MFQLKEDELNDAVILVFANKQDMPNAMSAAELTNALNLNSLRNRRVSNCVACISILDHSIGSKLPLPVSLHKRLNQHASDQAGGKLLSAYT